MEEKNFNHITDIDLLESRLKRKFSITAIADYCGVTRVTIYNRMAELNVTREDMEGHFGYVKRIIAFDINYKTELLERHLRKMYNLLEMEKRNPNLSVEIDYKGEFEEMILYMNSKDRL